MKKLPILMLSLMTLPAFAQDDVLSALNTYQESEATRGGQSSNAPAPDAEIKPSSETISSSSIKCGVDNPQTSLPLAYVTSLVKGGSLDILHEPRTGSLTVSADSMIGNCSSMLEWKIKQPEILGRKSYAIEVQIIEGDKCTKAKTKTETESEIKIETEDVCSYKFAKMENGSPKEGIQNFKPTLEGFKDCLKASGVVKDGKVVREAIYSTPLKEKFKQINQSAPLLFVSHGSTSPIIKAKYGQFEHINGCDYYETVHPQIRELLTYEDSEKLRLDAEATKLKDCKVDEYSKIADFIEKNENYLAQLGDIRDKLIQEAAKKSAEAILSGNYTEEDIKVISDFERYVVNPKVEKAIALYNQMVELEGDAKKSAQEELKLVLAEISALNQKPYFLPAHTHKLISDGRFEEAERLNSLKLVLEHNQRLGAKQNNVEISPEVAAERVAAAKSKFSSDLVDERERYEIRTGQVSGKSTEWTELASRMRNNIQTRTRNYMEEIQLEYARIQQPNGYCYKYWRNAQKCIQETMERIQQLQALAQQYNKVDAERAAEYDAKAKYYSDLETQGREYIAKQNGEPVPDAPSTATDNTVPTRRQDQPGTYTFDYQGGQTPGNGQQMYAPQMMPQQYQNPMVPFQAQNMFQQQNPWMQQQNPWLGQQGYGMQNYGYQQPGIYGQNYNAGFQMGLGMQQPGAGYWNQPHQAYNQYSVYGRTW